MSILALFSYLEDIPEYFEYLGPLLCHGEDILLSRPLHLIRILTDHNVRTRLFNVCGNMLLENDTSISISIAQFTKRHQYKQGTVWKE